MSRFTDATYEKNGETVRGRPVFCLTSPLVYEVSYLGSGWKVTAEEGFCTDLASWPSFLLRIKWLRSVAECMVKSAIVHDRLRANPEHPKIVGDYVYLEAMGVEKVPLFWRTLCFLAVLLNFRRD